MLKTIDKRFKSTTVHTVNTIQGGKTEYKPGDNLQLSIVGAGSSVLELSKIMINFRFCPKYDENYFIE